MKKMTKRLVGMLLLAGMLFAVPEEALAAEKASFTYETIDNSRSFEGGTFSNYFRYPKVKGNSKAAQRINQTLKKEGTRFVSMKGSYSMEEIAAFVARDSENYHTVCDYYNTTDGKVSYNKNGIFSIAYGFGWYVGGVSNHDFYGDTFDLDTGKKLGLVEVVADRYSEESELREAIYNKLKAKYDGEVADSFKEKYRTDKALRNADFLIDKKGRVEVCFRTYDISYGAAGTLFVILPSNI